MTKLRFFLVGVIVVCGWSIFGQKIKETFNPTPKPVYGEVQWMNRSVALQPGESMTFGPTFPDGGHIRYDVKASLPLTTGVSTSLKNPNGWCWESQILNAGKDCIVGNEPGEKFVYIKDDRGAGDVLGSLFLRSSQGVENNNVTVTIYRWGCISNCRIE